MGVKGLSSILTHYNRRRFAPVESQENGFTLALDVSCIFFKFAYSLDTEKCNGQFCFRDENIALDLEDIVEKFANLTLTINDVQEIVFCFDGSSRPQLKRHECEKRKKYENAKNRLIKKALNSKEFRFLLGKKFEQLYKNVIFKDASMEADAILCQYSKIVTVDSDIFMLSLFREKTISLFLLNKNQLPEIIEVDSFYKKNTITYVLYSIIAGNDYLPTLYHAQNHLCLFQLMENCVNLKDAYCAVKNKMRCKKIYNDFDSVNGVVKEWLSRIGNYLKYIKTMDQSYLCVGEVEHPKIALCNIELVTSCINNCNLFE
jgi:hypothetical protein